jgi:lipopolysaccharide export system protein LptA
MEKFDKEGKADLLANVMIVQGSKKAYSHWGEYFIHDKKMVLTGNPYLIDEKNSKFLSDKIIYDDDSKTMKMIGKGAGNYLYGSP